MRTNIALEPFFDGIENFGFLLVRAHILRGLGH
jgi:hypothetical protein